MSTGTRCWSRVFQRDKKLGQFYFSLFVVVSDVRIGRPHALFVSTVNNITQIHAKHRFLLIMNFTVWEFQMMPLYCEQWVTMSATH